MNVLQIFVSIILVASPFMGFSQPDEQKKQAQTLESRKLDREHEIHHEEQIIKDLMSSLNEGNTKSDSTLHELRSQNEAIMLKIRETLGDMDTLLASYEQLESVIPNSDTITKNILNSEELENRELIQHLVVSGARYNINAEFTYQLVVAPNGDVLEATIIPAKTHCESSELIKEFQQKIIEELKYNTVENESNENIEYFFYLRRGISSE